MKFSCVTVIFTLITLVNVFAQSPEQIDWHPGIVVLENEDVLKGDIAYDYMTEMVMCRQNKQVKIFGPRQARSFRYLDENTNIIHKYELYVIRDQNNYEEKAFFEIILKGHINYIRKRNKHRFRINPKSSLAEENQQAQPEFELYDYFAEKGGKMIQSKRFHKDLLPGLVELDQSIPSFMKEKNLKSYEVRDQIMLLSYYNRNETNLPPYALFSTDKLKTNFRAGKD
jgi:hypothetical protein